MGLSGIDRVDELKQVYKLAIETRNFEINNLIQRNNFYMLFQGVLLAAVFSNEASKPLVETVICCAGVIVSWYQIKVSAGAKYWQEHWEVVVDDIEKELEKVYVEKNDNNQILRIFKKDDIEFYRLFRLDNKKDKDNKNIFGRNQDANSDKGNSLLGICSFILCNKYNDNNLSERQKSILGKNYGFLGRVFKYFILSKPSVSVFPLKTAFVLCLTWLFLVLQTIHLPSENWNKFLNNTAYKYIQGLYFNDTNNKQDDCKDSKTQCHKTNTE